MNLLDGRTWIKKLVLLTTLTLSTTISLSIDIPAEAQLNPRPSIFKEYPYRRTSKKRKVKRSSINRPKAKPHSTKKQGTASNSRRRPFTQVHKKSPNEPFTIEFRAPGYPGSR